MTDNQKMRERIRVKLQSDELPKKMMHAYYEEIDWSEISHLKGYEREYAELEMSMRGMKAVLAAILEEI